ncbi:hypothetical protein [Leptolinea tardivitalis]|uniref:Methyl-accepting chemotaxis protein n=1 Tax=Leptolinea tardivitalis TaxID=229920 RepID=A0A0P6WSS6_9CHLR|nr:hypothetical protein [Leptolinea tardivitalis]KPL73288.1 hypothetical protein ADM99_03445 [Leptolinea tardivitalis]GAP21413.1 hypothetical protein LTAR_01624 [Leptolinea tardivitalis]
MRLLRRTLGILVLAAGSLGILLGLAGIVGLWLVRPKVVTSVLYVTDTLRSNLDVSSNTLTLAGETLDASIQSVDSLKNVLDNTIEVVADTQPVLDNLNSLMKDTLPSAFQAADDSLKAAQSAAVSLEGAIHSLDSFQSMLGNVPLLKTFLPAPQPPYNPEKTLAESLGNLSTNIKSMPSAFEDVSINIGRTDDNLTEIKDNFQAIKDNAEKISDSLKTYKGMLAESQASMQQTKWLLEDFSQNVEKAVTITFSILSVFFFCVLMSQVVVLKQGWEMLHN